MEKNIFLNQQLGISVYMKFVFLSSIRPGGLLWSDIFLPSLYMKSIMIMGLE
jgi:hypothetical protein